jgi:hypothetical protein
MQQKTQQLAIHCCDFRDCSKKQTKTTSATCHPGLEVARM